MVTVRTKDELKNAVSRREHILVTNKSLAKKLSLLMYVEKGKGNLDNLLVGKSNAVAGAALAGLAGIPISVAITLIITLGLVTIVAILRNYRISKTNYGDIMLEPA